MKLYLLQAVSENLKGALNRDARDLYRDTGDCRYIYQIPWDSCEPTAYYFHRAKLLKRRLDATVPD